MMVVLDQQHGTRVRDIARFPVYLDSPAVASAARREHSPDGAGLVGPRPGRLEAIVARHDEQRAGGILWAQRRERLARYAEQLLDRQFGLEVATLAVAVLGERALRGPQVARRPADVLVLLPEREVAVEQDRMRDLEALNRGADRLLARRRTEAGAVRSDHDQSVIDVAFVPGLDVGEGAQRVRPAEVPELDQHWPAAQLVHGERGRIDPGRAGRECRRGDRVDRWAHGGRR